jgi:hypothetical protein
MGGSLTHVRSRGTPHHYPAEVRAARAWHLATAAVAAVALVLQLILVIEGGRVLEEAHPPSMGLRLVRFLAYFTVQSNILVLVCTVPLARAPSYDGRAWRVLRTAAVTGIAVTGLVHWFLLRPLLHLHGADLVADKLLHLAVPLLAVVGWLVFGPRPRTTWPDSLRASVWPVAPLPIPRPPAPRLGPRGRGLRGHLRAVVRAARGRARLRPADASGSRRDRRRHW